MPNIDRAKPAFLALSCVGFVSSIAAAGAAAAATADVEPGANAGPDEGTIIVTAEMLKDGYHQEAADTPKLTAPLIDTPRSVVVVPKELIKDTGSASLADALRTVPGITFGAAEGGNPIGDRPFIRGFDSQGSSYLDGVRDLGAQTREVFDVDQIQIVRGSDSTLGGRGSAGGTINIISKLPTGTNAIEADASLGTADYERATIDVNRKLTDTIGVRIAAMGHHQDVAGRDAIWQKRWGIAPSITLGMGTPTRLTAAWYHLHSNELPDSGIPYLTVCSATICNAPAGKTLDYPAHHFTTIGGEEGTVSRDNFYGVKSRDFRTATTDQGTLRFEQDLASAFTLRNTLRYSRTSQDYIYTLPDDSNGNVYGTDSSSPVTAGGQVWRRANTRFGSDRGLIDQLDLAGKFKTGTIEHSIATGVEGSLEKARRGAYVLATGSTISPRCSPLADDRYYCTSVFAPDPDDPWANYSNDSDAGVPTPITKGAPATETINKADTLGAYAFDSVTLTPALIANLGVRVDRFHSRALLPVATGARPEVARTDTLFNWQAGLVFKPTKSSSLYASYATAATPPNSILGEGREDNSLGSVQDAAEALKVQKTKSWEAGAKTDLFGDALSLTLDIFRTKTANARVTGPDNTIEFIGTTRSQGVEFGVNGRITPEWSVFGGYSFLDAKITDGGFTATTGGGVTVVAPSINTGKRVPQTARNSATLFTTYQVTPRFSVGGGAFWFGRVYGGYADDRHIENGALVITREIARAVPGYVRLDATADYKIGEHWDLRINVQNLTDKRYFSQAYSSHYATVAPGRSALATLSLHY